jgi:hypothetical protein
LLGWLGAGSGFGAGGWIGSLFCGGAEVVVALLAVPGLDRGAVGGTIGVLVRYVSVIGTVDSHGTSGSRRETEASR